MKKIHITAFINAPREKVWHAMLDDASYREWTKAFNPGSYYKGEWKEGSKMLFLGPNPVDGKEGGMVSRIRTVKPYEYVGIEHLGVISNGVEDTTSDGVKAWVGAQENYAFTEKDGGTELVVDSDVVDEMYDEMLPMWEAALKELKKIAER